MTIGRKCTPSETERQGKRKAKGNGKTATKRAIKGHRGKQGHQEETEHFPHKCRTSSRSGRKCESATSFPSGTCGAIVFGRPAPSKTLGINMVGRRQRRLGEVAWVWGGVMAIATSAVVPHSELVVVLGSHARASDSLEARCGQE